MSLVWFRRCISRFVLISVSFCIYLLLKTPQTMYRNSLDMQIPKLTNDSMLQADLTTSYNLRENLTHRGNRTTEISKIFHSKINFNFSCKHLLDFPLWVNIECNSTFSNLTVKSGLKSQSHDPNALCQSKFTCFDLLNGSNKKVYSLVRDFMKHHQKPMASDSDLEWDGKNCTRLKENGYWSKSIDTEDYPIAFNLIVHKDAHQIEQLLRSIYRPQNAYCIHIDPQSDPAFLRAFKNLVECFDNVWISSKSESISWGGYSRLQADINCMEDLMKSKIEWRYLINTAGQAFPLKTPEEMVRVLKIYNGANDFEGIYGERVLRSRFEMEWIENGAKKTVEKSGKKNPPPPHNIDIVRGSAYGIFSRNFVKLVLNDTRAVDFRNWAKKTWSPEEFYWSTLHHAYVNPQIHAPGRHNGGSPKIKGVKLNHSTTKNLSIVSADCISNKKLSNLLKTNNSVTKGHPEKKPWLAVYANWYPYSCTGRVVRGVCVFGVEDLPHLLERKEFFANKFYSTFQPLALDCMEAWIKHKEQCPVEFEESYYRKLPFIYHDNLVP